MSDEKKQAQASRAADDTARFELMDSWLKENGGRYPSLFVQSYAEDYRGIHTDAGMNKSDELMCIPKKCLITNEVVNQESAIVKKLKNAKTSLTSKQLFVSIYILEERAKGESSFWYPYLNILPRYLNSIPLFYTQEEKELLKGTPFQSRIVSRINRYEADYKVINATAPEFGEKHTLKDFIWARVIVQSRIFGMHIDGVKTSGMVPLADMINHNMEANTSWTYDNSKQGFVMTARCAILAGDSVLDSYGARPHTGYFLDYGMYLEEADKVVEVDFRIPGRVRDRALFARKKVLVNNRQFSTFELSRDYDADSAREAFGFLRVAYANPNEVHSLETRGKISLKTLNPLSLANEAQVIMQLADKCRTYLMGFDETAMEDLELLNSDDPPYSVLSYNQRTCIEIRLGEKLAAGYYLSLASVSLPMIENKLTHSQAEQYMDSLNLKLINPDLRYYLKHVLLKIFPDTEQDMSYNNIDVRLLRLFCQQLRSDAAVTQAKQEQTRRAQEEAALRVAQQAQLDTLNEAQATSSKPIAIPIPIPTAVGSDNELIQNFEVVKISDS